MGDAKQDKDVRLVKECLEGSEKAWQELYSGYLGLVRVVVRRQKWSPSAEDVEDVTQMVFTTLLSKLGKYEGGYPLSAFISEVSKFTTWDEIRKRRAEMRGAPTVSLEDIQDAGAQVPGCMEDPADAAVIQAELMVILQRAIWDLKPDCWQLLTLRELEELPYKEISEILGQTENTLTVKARRCLEDLRANYMRLMRKGCTCHE